MTALPILSIIVFLPLAGAFLLFLLKDANMLRWTAFVVTFVDFILIAALMLEFDPHTSAMQFRETNDWVPELGIGYKLGIDGISLLFLFLTGLLGWISVLASWHSITHKVKEFMVAILVMQTLMLGVFASLDLFLFYVFWEAMLIPMYIIIGVWGGKNRVYAAFKFFLYTLAGSLLFLIGILVLYFNGGETFDVLALMEASYSVPIQTGVFLAFLIAFAVKVPMVPFHTWLPDAHVQAPTAGSIILAGVLLKMGAYGFIRFSLPMLPDASQYFAPFMLIMSVIAIIYGGFLALAQEDVKKLIAYSSVSHMGFVTLGLFTFNENGTNGAIIQMFNHGITTGALFLFIGLIYERTHTRDITAYGGLMKRVPVYSVFFGVFVLSAMAVPGTNGFVGEILVLAGAFGANLLVGAAAIIGAVLGAAYLLGLYRQMVLGPKIDMAGARFWDFGTREVFCALPLAVFVFWVGFYPKPFLVLISASVEHLLVQASGG